jgi:hypothetical protein
MPNVSAKSKKKYKCFDFFCLPETVRKKFKKLSFIFGGSSYQKNLKMPMPSTKMIVFEIFLINFKKICLELL